MSMQTVIVPPSVAAPLIERISSHVEAMEAAGQTRLDWASVLLLAALRDGEGGKKRGLRVTADSGILRHMAGHIRVMTETGKLTTTGVRRGSQIRKLIESLGD